MDPNSLYQELIAQHSRRPRHRGVLEDATAVVSMRNPGCGDEITLQLRVADGRIEAVRFEGEGCSISQASASMMSELLEGKTIEESRALLARFTELVQGRGDAARDRSLGDLRALSGVARFPVRVRCALLAWDALREAGKGV
jgi:nitrogen fixation NifU-like protein